MTATLVLLGVMATTYAGPFVGQPLYCDRDGSLIYGQVSTPWVALDVTEFQSGRVRCGDPIHVRFPGETPLVARALDAGNLYPHTIAQTGRPIAVDVPAHLAPFDGLSAEAEIHLSAAHPHLTR